MLYLFKVSIKSNYIDGFLLSVSVIVTLRIKQQIIQMSINKRITSDKQVFQVNTKTKYLSAKYIQS